MKFEAAVLESIGASTLTLAELDCTGPKYGEVLVRMAASGICHTDLEVMQGAVAYPVPIVLGHEGAGIIEAVGPGVTEAKPGDHVICSWNPHCGNCFQCERGQPILCEPYGAHQRAGKLMDGTSRYSWEGLPVHHFAGVSSHAQYAIVPAASAIVVPSELPLDRACVIGCGVMTGVGAVSRLAKVSPGSAVLVVGAGAVGLNAIQGAVIQRAEIIVAVDRDSDKLDMARRFGATHTWLANDAAVADEIRAITFGRGVDYSIECAGHETAIQLSLEALRKGGMAVLLGKTPVSQLIALRFGSLMGEKQIVRSSYGGARPKRDFPWLARLYLEGLLKLDELITQRLSLAEINRGIQSLRMGQGIRSIVQFEGQR